MDTNGSARPTGIGTGREDTITNQTAARSYRERLPAQYLLPRAGAEHRALVRQIRAAEGDLIADQGALAALERAERLLTFLAMSELARDYLRDQLHEVRQALILKVWPMGPRT